MQRIRSILTGVAGTPWYLNHYFLGDDNASSASAAIAQVAAFWDALDGLMDNAITIAVQGDVPTIDVGSGEMTAVNSVAGDTEAGDSVGLPLPYATQGAVQWNTDVFTGGRRLVGRSFLPGFTADTLESDGTPTAGTLTGIDTAANALVGGTPAFCVWSRTHGVAASVESWTVRNAFWVMRSRRD
jgi:hypothetical protein